MEITELKVVDHLIPMEIHGGADIHPTACAGPQAGAGETLLE